MWAGAENENEGKNLTHNFVTADLYLNFAPKKPENHNKVYETNT